MKIAIAGFGLEGRVNYNYFRNKYPQAEVVIVDESSAIDRLPENATTLLGETAFERLQDFDMVVRTAGLAPDKIVTNGKIWSATNEFFDKCPARIVGVTGTKGKGTTSSLIASVLRAAGHKVHLLGNIGTPALEVLADIEQDDVVVYELSSFQLWDLERSPNVAVVLMIEPDHLDVHASFEQYIEAKSHIAKFQQPEDMVIYHPDNQFSRQIASLGNGKKQRFGVLEDGGVYTEMNNFCVQGDAICSVEALYIVGQHNIDNACAAISAVLGLGLDVSREAIKQGLSDFKGLAHRLSLVIDKNGIKYYDDSIATTPGSVIAAIRAFSQPKVLVLGGVDKGSDYSTMVQMIGDQASMVRGVVLIGSNAEKLNDLLRDVAVEKTLLGNQPMSQIVKKATAMARAGDVVILSPAASSFDMFKNYQDRGTQFAEAVRILD